MRTSQELGTTPRCGGYGEAIELRYSGILAAVVAGL
jgi:hypothetical protein